MKYLVTYTFSLKAGQPQSIILELTENDFLDVKNIEQKIDVILDNPLTTTRSITGIFPLTTPAPQQTIRTIEFNGVTIPVNNISYYRKTTYDPSIGIWFALNKEDKPPPPINIPCIVIKLKSGEEIRKEFYNEEGQHYPAEVNRDIAFDELHRKYTTGKP